MLHRLMMAVLSTVVFVIVLLYQVHLNATYRFNAPPQPPFSLSEKIVRIDNATGDVYIDWTKAEEYANSCTDFTTPACAITRIMMAIRKDEWEPLQ
jgi:hypothetical protein